MDLVQSYDSEMDNDSEIEYIEPPAKNVEFIDLDSDDESGKKADDAETPKPGGRTPDTNASRVIDLIDLDTPEKKNPPEKASEKSITSKKIDYLNLEDSGSDVECENDAGSVNNLLENASVLADKPAGPPKPTELPGFGTESDRESLKNASARNTPDFVHSSLSRDSAENSVADPSERQQPSTDSFMDDNADLSCIFREDERVLEASEKNILCRIPRQIAQTHNAHKDVIMSLGWCIPKYSYLYLSASQDGLLKVWDLYRKNAVQCIRNETGFNAAKWSLDGGQIVAGGIGKKAFVYDVQTGKKIAQYDIYNVVASLEVHPYMEDVFLCGTRNAVLGFDIRVNTTFPIRSYFSKCEEVLDIVFLDENEFICSTNIVSHDSADRTIMAWDFSSGAILSNQIYLERYTCPSLKVHPFDSTFIAQTNGNYIASFSTSRPYKMKTKRYLGHKVSGYGIECDISPDGKYVVSGDVEGSVYFYNYSNTNTVLVTPETKKPTNKVKWHPVLASTLITSTYDGQILVWK